MAMTESFEERAQRVADEAEDVLMLRCCELLGSAAWRLLQCQDRLGFRRVYLPIGHEGKCDGMAQTVLDQLADDLPDVRAAIAEADPDGTVDPELVLDRVKNNVAVALREIGKTYG